MALFMNQQNERTDFQKRIAAELAEKSKKKALEHDGQLPDGVTDSAYLKGTKKTTPLAWAWILIIIAFLGLLLWLVVATA